MARQTLHVLLRKEELDRTRAARTVVVVVDVLFATSTIATLLHHGAAEVIPVVDGNEARERAAALTPGTYVIAGEKDGLPIEGFAAAMPLELLKVAVRGKRIVYCTTNGTVAIRRAEGARALYAGSVLNAPAVAGHILSAHAAETVLIVCAGSGGGFNLEDFFGAGCLVHHLVNGAPDRFRLTDAAQAALGLYTNPALGAERCLEQSRIGQQVALVGLAEEVRYAAREGVVPVVPALEDGALRARERGVP